MSQEPLAVQIRQMLNAKELLFDSEVVSISYDYVPLCDKPLFVVLVARKVLHDQYVPEILLIKADILYGESPQGKNLVRYKAAAPVITLKKENAEPLTLPLDDLKTVKFSKGYLMAEIRRMTNVSKDHGFIYYGLGSHGYQFLGQHKNRCVGFNCKKERYDSDTIASWNNQHPPSQ